jgi:type VI secretion system secreted protein Hcp
VKAEPLTIVKELDKTSPTFAQFCCNGQHIPEVTIELCRASCDKAKYLEIRMENVLISGYSVSSGGDRPMESISLNFAKMTIDYFDQDAKDNPKTGTVAWDCPSWPDCTCRS